MVGTGMYTTFLFLSLLLNFGQDVKDIARHDNDDHKGEVKDVEIIHVLDQPWSYDNNPKWLRFNHVLLDEARSLTETAVTIDGLTVSDTFHDWPNIQTSC